MTPIEPGSPEWQLLVSRARSADTASAWEVGDAALQAAPMSTRGRSDDALRRFAEDTEISFPKLQRYRLVSNAWPNATRVASCSHRTHLRLASLPDRFQLIHSGMKAEEAEAIAAQRKQTGGDPTRTTLLSILASVTESRHRLRVAFRDTMAFDPSDSDKEHILGNLAELETETEQFRNYLTGMGLDEAITAMLEETR